MTDLNSAQTSETAGELIAATRVDGTNVYNSRGERIGEVSDLMIGKRSGKVSYAVMSFGGFLGLGESYHPLPWSVLKYDERLGGYVVDVDTEKLRDAPRFGAEEDPQWRKEDGKRIDEYYGVPTTLF